MLVADEALKVQVRKKRLQSEGIAVAKWVATIYRIKYPRINVGNSNDHLLKLGRTMHPQVLAFMMYLWQWLPSLVQP